MKNAKAFVLVSLLSVAGLAIAHSCCQSTEVAAPEVAAEVVVAEVVPAVDVEAEAAARAKKLADDKLAADAAQLAQEVVVADKE